MTGIGIKAMGWAARVVLALALWQLGAGPATADSRVIVMGVQSLDGDDEVARELDETLRKNAKSVPGWAVSPKRISLAQMTLAQGCETTDPGCLADIARMLKVDRLIYGVMQRSGRNADDGFQVQLYLFDAVSGRFEGSALAEVDRDKMEPAPDSALVAGLVRQLAGLSTGATIVVQGSTPGVTVRLDGEQAGKLGVDGQLTLEGVAQGDHEIEVEYSDGPRTGRVSVQDAQRAEVSIREEGETGSAGLFASDDQDPNAADADGEFVPAAADGDPRWWNRNRVLAVSSLVLAAGSAVGMTVSWVGIQDINDNSDFIDFRSAFPPPGSPGGTDDVCVNAEQRVFPSRPTTFSSERWNDLKLSGIDLCDQASRLEVMQYVFLASAVVTGAAGALLLLMESKETEVLVGKASTRLQVRPMLGQSQQGVMATLRF